jgi:hypothetical protein
VVFLFVECAWKDNHAQMPKCSNQFGIYPTFSASSL